MNTTSTGIVAAKEFSKNGKPKLNIEGRWYFAGKCDISSLNVGDRIDFEWNTFGDDPSKPLYGLQNWGKSANQPSPAEIEIAKAAATPKKFGGGGKFGGRGSDRDLEIDLQCMRFTGQIVSSLVEKGEVDLRNLVSATQTAWDAIKFTRALGGTAPAPATPPSQATATAGTPVQAPQGGQRVRPTGNFGFGKKYRDTPWNVMDVRNLAWFRDAPDMPADVKQKCIDELWFREQDQKHAAATQPDPPSPDDDFSDDIPF